jgi:hypothetical protein
LRDVEAGQIGRQVRGNAVAACERGLAAIPVWRLATRYRSRRRRRRRWKRCRPASPRRLQKC